MNRRFLNWSVYGLLLVGVILTMLPLIWMISASLMPAGESNVYPPRLFPSRITLEHYEALFTRLDLARYLFNSTLLATAVTLISLLLNSMAGYAFAKLRFPGRNRLFKTLLAALVIPAQVSMLPLFLLLKQMLILLL